MIDGRLSERFWTRDFVVILTITFLTYANISVFFEFFAYLKTCPIDPSWFGTLIGIFAGVSLLARPLVIPFIQPGNARGFLILGTVLAVLALGFYSLTQSLWGLMGVRIFHGLAFVVMGSALTALMMSHVPKGGSARFFGILSIVILIPNTLVPPLLPTLTRAMGGLPMVLLGFAGLTSLIFFLLPLGLRMPLFLVLGSLVGLGWGLAMPVFNGLMFDISAPRFQSFNTNLGFQMYQAGFFVGPFIGSALAETAGFRPVFFLAALISLAGSLMMGVYSRSKS